MIEVSGNRLRVAGPMVIDAASVLKRDGDQAVAGGAAIIDLAGVTDADSSAVAVLLSWVRVARERRTAIGIINPPDSIRSLAALYGVSDLLPLA